MENVMELLKSMSDDASNINDLREIALLMEENEELKDRVREKEKEIKNLIKHVRGKNNA